MQTSSSSIGRGEHKVILGPHRCVGGGSVFIPGNGISMHQQKFFEAHFHYTDGAHGASSTIVFEHS